MTVTTVRSKEVRLVKYCKAWPTEDIFQVAEQEVALHAAKGSGDIVLKLLWSSVDPYIRSRLQLPEKGALSVLAPFELGKVPGPLLLMNPQHADLSHRDLSLTVPRPCSPCRRY